MPDRPSLDSPTEPPSSLLTRPASLWPNSVLADAPAVEAAQHERVATRLDLCHSTLALRVIAGVQAVVGVAGMAGADSALAWADHAAVPAVAALAGTLVWLAVVCTLRHALARWPAPLRAGFAVLVGAGAAVAGWSVLPFLNLAPMSAWQATVAALTGAGLAGGIWAWLALRDKAARPADASARLAELQSRIRPHFLFNALNTALALVRLDPQRAEQVLEDLAELFRAALAESGAAVSLADEIELAQRYLAIEETRFGERLRVEWDLDPAAGRARVPPLVLQPLVENAVRHGVEPAADGGRVLVRSQVRAGSVVVTVRNTVDAKAAARPGSGIALANVRERLALLHDIGGTLDTGLEGDQFVARMRVPL